MLSVGVLLLLLFDGRCSLFVVHCLMSESLFAAARGAVFAVRALSVAYQTPVARSLSFLSCQDLCYRMSPTRTLDRTQ